jgi:hypothetical protein
MTAKFFTTLAPSDGREWPMQDKSENYKKGGTFNLILL